MPQTSPYIIAAQITCAFLLNVLCHVPVTWLWPDFPEMKEGGGGGAAGGKTVKPVTTVQDCVLKFVSVKTTGVPALFVALFFEILKLKTEHKEM